MSDVMASEALAGTDVGVPAKSVAAQARHPDIGRWVRSIPWAVLPFLLFCILLEVIPVIVLVRDRLRVLGMGAFTLENYMVITEPV